MIIEKSTPDRRPAVSKVTLMMVICGAVSVFCAGVASADPAEDAPRITVKFDPKSFATEDGARAVYRRLEKAAELVCPNPMTGTRLVNPVIAQCRTNAVKRAIQQIDNPRLVEVSTSLAKRG